MERNTVKDAIPNRLGERKQVAHRHVLGTNKLVSSGGNGIPEAQNLS